MFAKSTSAHLPPCGGGWEGGRQVLEPHLGHGLLTPHPHPPREGEGAFPRVGDAS